MCRRCLAVQARRHHPPLTHRAEERTGHWAVQAGDKATAKAPKVMALRGQDGGDGPEGTGGR
jgi:hypothetical protein